jgi:rsbT co-antagonist protein RsbR
MAYDPVQMQKVEIERRRKILEGLLIISFVLALALTLLLIALRGITRETSPTVVSMSGLCLSFVAAWGLSRAGYQKLASHLYFMSMLVVGVLVSIGYGTASNAMLVVFIPIVGAPLLLRPRWCFVYAGLALLAYLIVLFGSADYATWDAGGYALGIAVHATYYGLIGLIAFLLARSYERMLDATMQHAAELERSRATLEQRVEERTREIRAAMADLQRSAETIRELSVPVVPIGDGVLLLPLVGSIDSQRAALLLNQLLEALYRERAHAVLLDVTGVPVVDTQVARVLVQAAQAVRLLGAEPVLVGLRAEVAQTIIGLGLDLGEITALRDVRDGLAHAQRLARVAA